MDAAHLHLMLNHIPVLGTAFGMALIAWALFRKSEELKRLAWASSLLSRCWLFRPISRANLPKRSSNILPGVSEPAIEEHEEAATFAFAGVLVLGAAALGGLIFHWRGKPVPKFVPIVALGCPSLSSR